MFVIWIFLVGISFSNFIRSAGFIAACMPRKEIAKYSGQANKAKLCPNHKNKEKDRKSCMFHH